MEGSNESCFVWDENFQLYYHSRSGFYHDPVAGWYYSSRDGLYYKYENGSYVLLEPCLADQSELFQSGRLLQDSPNQDEPSANVCSHRGDDCSRLQGDSKCGLGTTPDEYITGEGVGNRPFFQGGDPQHHGSLAASEEPVTALMENDSPLGENLPPPSEWLEETLIDLYLSGYSNQEMIAASDARMPVETDNWDTLNPSADGAGKDNDDEIEEGEWVPDDSPGTIDSSGSVMPEGASWDEDNWRAQYGQVVQSGEEPVQEIPVVDLWDWKIASGPKKHGKGMASRLVGRLVKRSTKLHPSMPSGGGLLKTAPICEVHLDLVKVTTGQVYKLRSPSTNYLASLATYDSSNPTKDWGFPDLSIDGQMQHVPRTRKNCESEIIEGVPVRKEVSLPPKQLTAPQKKRSCAYRDRAAERRSLHGGFGVGPGQKKLSGDVDLAATSSASTCPEEAAAESLNMSFGAGSYARRMLENMGWKEGEALGNSTKGLKEPLQAVGNKGNAGLGWDQEKRKL